MEIPDIAPGQVIAGADFVNQGDELMARKFKRRQGGGHSTVPSSVSITSTDPEYTSPHRAEPPIAPTIAHSPPAPECASPPTVRQKGSVPPIVGIQTQNCMTMPPRLGRAPSLISEGPSRRSFSANSRFPTQPKFHVDGRVGSYFEERRATMAPGSSLNGNGSSGSVSGTTSPFGESTRPSSGCSTGTRRTPLSMRRSDLDSLAAVITMEKSLYKDKEMEQTREAAMQANRKIQLAKLQSRRKQKQRLDQRAGIYRDPCEVEGPEDDEETYIASIQEEHGVVASRHNAHTIALRKALREGSPRSLPPGTKPPRPKRPPPFERSFREVQEEFEHKKAILAQMDAEDRMAAQQAQRSQTLSSLHSRRAEREMLESKLGTYYQRVKAQEIVPPLSPRSRSKSLTELDDPPVRVLNEINYFETALSECHEKLE